MAEPEHEIHGWMDIDGHRHLLGEEGEVSSPEDIPFDDAYGILFRSYDPDYPADQQFYWAFNPEPFDIDAWFDYADYLSGYTGYGIGGEE